MLLNSVLTPVQIDKAALERSEQAREQYRISKTGFYERWVS